MTCCSNFLDALRLLLPQRQFLFHYSFLFMLGMLSFQTHPGLLRRDQCVLWLLPLAIGAWLTVGDLPAKVDVLLAWGLYVFVEKPKRRRSSGIRYRRPVSVT